MQLNLIFSRWLGSNESDPDEYTRLETNGHIDIGEGWMQ